MTELVDQLLDRWAACKQARQSLETVWEDLADLYRPSRAGFTGARAPGDSRMQRVYDGEQIEAVTELAHSIESMTVPRGEKWVEIGTEDEVEADDDEAAEWLDDAGKTTLKRIYDPRAGWQNAGGQLFADLVVFGAGPVFMGSRSDLSGFLFRSSHLRDVHWWRDEAGLPEYVFGRLSLRPEEAAARFGKENLSPDTRRVVEDDKSGKAAAIEFVEVVAPRYSGVVGSAHARDMPFGAYLIEVAKRHIVREGGYLAMPWIIPEWEVLDGDIWSPGRRGLPDVMQLQAMAKTILRGAQKHVDPPWMAASDGIFGRVNLTPGFVNYFDATAVSRLQGRVNLIEPLVAGGDIKLGLDMQMEQRRKVGELFLRNVLRLPDKTGMTATEVLRLNADLVRLTDSPFGRLETNLIQPLVELAFNMLLRDSIALRFGPGSPFKPLPQALAGRKVAFKFLSPVARARKAAETAQLATWFESMQPMIAAKPEVLDNFDTDQIARDFTSVGLAPKYVVPKDQVAALRQARQQQAMAQQQLDAAHQTADAAGKAAPFMKVLADQTGQAKRIGVPA